MASAVIAESKSAVLERLKSAAQGAGIDEMKTAASLEVALEEVRTGEHQLLVVGPTLAVDAAFDLAEHSASEHKVATVLAVNSVSTEYMRRAMRSSVADVAVASDPIPEISEALRNGLGVAAKMRTDDSSEYGDSAGRTAGGKVITVFSTKGGVGKTVLATNLGVAMAKKNGSRVAVLDLDLEFGDVAIMLGIKPEHTIADVVQVFDRLDADLLAGYMSDHSSGLDVLLAPIRPEEAESVSAARISQIIQMLREAYDFVVVDTSPSFSETVLAALDKSDEVLVVTMMDVASVKNTRISLQKLDQMGYDHGKVRIVLNRADSKVLLQPSEVEDAIGGKVVAHIPSDRIVPRSVNKGVPVVIDMPKSNVAKSILSLAESALEPVAKEADDVVA